MRPLFIILASLLLVSCSTRTSGKAGESSQAHQEPIAVFDSLLSLQENLERGNMDTFSVQGRVYRLRRDSVTGDNLLEANVKSRWEKALTLFLADEFEKVDYNADGYPDLLAYHNGWNRIHFYDPKQGQFDSSEVFIGADDLDTIPGRKQMFFSWRERNHGCDHPQSQLFTFENGQIRFLYLLDFFTPCESEHIQRVDLYRYETPASDTGTFVKSYSASEVAHKSLRGFWTRLLDTTSGIQHRRSR